MNKSFQCFSCGKITINGWYYNKFNPKRYNTEKKIMKLYHLAVSTEYFCQEEHNCLKIDDKLNMMDCCDNCEEKIHNHVHTPIEELNTDLSLTLKLSVEKEEMRKKYYGDKKLKNL